MEIQLREVLALTHRMSEIIAHHTGRPVEQVAQDIDRDYYMTAEEARDYGIIDDIILPRRGSAPPAAPASSRAPGERRPTRGPRLHPRLPCDASPEPSVSDRVNGRLNTSVSPLQTLVSHSAVQGRTRGRHARGAGATWAE